MSEVEHKQWTGKREVPSEPIGNVADYYVEGDVGPTGIVLDVLLDYSGKKERVYVRLSRLDLMQKIREAIKEIQDYDYMRRRKE